MASDAIERQAYEDAHSLAWRAVQTSPRNDPSLLFLLARTQSLSGRLDDALVMLRRLAGMGFRTPDAETSDDFRHVRTLAGWPRVLDAIHGGGLDVPAPAPVIGSARVPEKPPTPSPMAPSNAGLRVPARVAAALALAYDAVSRRFVLADDSSDTLKVLDELAGNVVDLVGQHWAAPYRPMAMAIDTSRGDLWVAGVHASAEGGPQSALHRLQLISGRLLQTIPLQAAAGPTRLTDIAIARDTVFVLDALGGRIFSLARGATSPRLHMTITGLAAPASFALAGDAVLYAAHPRGIVRVDVGQRTSRAIAAKDSDVAALQSIAWHRGSLFGVQNLPEGTQVAVRLHLNRDGTRATSRGVLGPAASRAIALTGGVFYYLGIEADGTGVVLTRYQVSGVRDQAGIR